MQVTAWVTQWLEYARRARGEVFGREESPDGREITDDPETVKLCASAFESAWERGIPHQEYRPA